MNKPQGFKETLEWLIKDKDCELFYDEGAFLYFIYQWTDEIRIDIAHHPTLDGIVAQAYEKLKDE